MAAFVFNDGEAGVEVEARRSRILSGLSAHSAQQRDINVGHRRHSVAGNNKKKERNDSRLWLNTSVATVKVELLSKQITLFTLWSFGHCHQITSSPRVIKLGSEIPKEAEAPSRRSVVPAVHQKSLPSL